MLLVKRYNLINTIDLVNISQEFSMLKVGYIGLGLMGKNIARNILKAGFPLVVHNRSQAAVDELVAEGATRASSPEAVAQQVDVVFTNLPDSPDVELVVLGEKGITAGAKKGLNFSR